ncbi:unnamed protein product [Ilex paraguariensis]|uniref:Protein kinase domain-containing protein n=1 Tax=Ilex paraguariensis TaxID=185542 RepID=A0ABC8SPV4_9AQUA
MGFRPMDVLMVESTIAIGSLTAEKIFITTVILHAAHISPEVPDFRQYYMAAVRLLALLTHHLFLFFIFLTLCPLSFSLLNTKPNDVALLQLKESFNNTTAVDSWKKGTNPCDNNEGWAGVICLNGVVTNLNLANFGLSGGFNVDALSDLRSIRIISVENNSFSGPIPEFNRLGSLKAIFLSRNQFSGEIPSDFFSNTRSLKKLRLSANKFSGKIPDSIGKIPHLLDLHLEFNEFSGPIPPIEQQSLTSLNLSNNKLEGEIPESLSRFSADSFIGNPDLCGKQAGKDCNNKEPLVQEENPQVSSPENMPKESNISNAKWVVLGLIVAVLLFTLLSKAKRKDDDFDMLRKENLDDVVHVHIPSSNRRSMSPSRKGLDSSHSTRGRRSSRHAAHISPEVPDFRQYYMAAVRLLALLTHHLFLFFIFLTLCPLSFSLLNTKPNDVALLQLKESFNNTTAVDSWKKGTNPCDNNEGWAGVICLNGVVTNLNLANFGLSGGFNVDALSDLRSIRIISVENNSFSGPIPEFNRLGSLKAIFLSRNQFSGEIPSDFFSNTRSLKKLRLSANKFSGKIPDSIGKIPHLLDLHLEFNEFSGPIPPIEQQSLTSLNLSNNKLEGEIPESLSRFSADSFIGNPDLCGKQAGKDCNNKEPLVQEENPQVSSPENMPKESNISNAKWVVLGLIVAVLLFTLLSKAKRKDDDFDMLRKENLDDVVHVHIPSSNRRSMSPSRKGLDSSHSTRGRRSSRHGKSSGDLVVVNEEKGLFGLPDLMKAAAEVLGNGGLGSAYKAMMANGVSVVVKRLRETNKLSSDSFDCEIRRLGKLSHRNILTPLAYHYRKEEKLLVSTYVPTGSLLYVLHGDRGISHAKLNWPTRLKIIKGIARGVGFLHSEFATYELPHGNLKSSNVLLDSNYEPLLNDYAFHPLINNTQSVQSLFAYKSPEAILYQQVSQKSDVFCFGIITLELLTGKFPSQYLSNQKGGTDVVQWVRSAISENRVWELIDPDLTTAAADSLVQIEKLLHIAAACTESDQDKRMNMKEAIRRIEDIQV